MGCEHGYFKEWGGMGMGIGIGVGKARKGKELGERKGKERRKEKGGRKGKERKRKRKKKKNTEKKTKKGKESIDMNIMNQHDIDAYLCFFPFLSLAHFTSPVQQVLGEKQDPPPPLGLNPAKVKQEPHTRIPS
jgi:hypothetical protein